MELKHLKLPGAAALVLDAAAADRMLSLRDGDAALLYLYLLRQNGSTELGSASSALGWTAERTAQASSLLTQAGLLASDAPAAARPAQPEGPPEYAAEEIAQEMKGNSTFSFLVEDVESRLGRVLSTTDLKILYGLYDYLSLSEEVIPLLITYCTEECRLESNKEGRMPGMRQIEREAYSWRRQGVDTPERAVEHIKAQRARRSRQGRILEALGIEGRTPVPSERRYIDEWIDMGFSAEAVSIAFDRTVLKTGGLKWPYLNSILKSWHQKGLHTPEEIETGDSASPSAAQPRKPADSAASDREAIAWMREYVKNKRVSDVK